MGSRKPKIDPRDHDVECCCGLCGGTRVQYAVWRNPNTGEVGEEFGSWGATDSKFCADCDEEGRDPNPRLVDKGGDVADFIRLRAKWRAEHDDNGNRTIEIDDAGYAKEGEHAR